MGTRGPIAAGRSHGDVDILKDGAWSDAARAVGGFDEVIAALAVMFPAEHVDEGERLGELSGADEKTRTVDHPFGL